MKKWQFIIGVLGLVLFFSGCDSPSSIEDPEGSHFIKFYGRDGDQTGRDLIVLPDGSMVLFGTTRPTDATAKGTEWLLVKVDPKGNVLWEKEFGRDYDDEASDIELTANGRIVLLGNSYNIGGDRDILIKTLTLDGVEINSSVVVVRDGAGNPTTGDEIATSVTETTDGFIISGSTTFVYFKPVVSGLSDLRDALKVRLNNDLTPYPNSWVQTYGYYSDDQSEKIIQVSANLFYVFGYTNSLPPGQSIPNYNFWIYSLGANGDFLNSQLYPGTPSGNERMSSFTISPAISVDGYFLGGLSQKPATPSEFYIAKLRNQLGFVSSDIQFEKALSVSLGSNLNDRTSVCAAQSGGYFIMGNENGFNNNQNWVLTKVNLDGSLAWNLPIVFGGDGLDECGAIKELPDNRIILIGTMRTGRPDAGEFKLTLVKVSANGKFEN